MATGVRDLAPAVTRAIQILQALATAARPIKTGELASLLGLPKSSVHGVCSSLLTGGLIERTDSGEYVLGMRLLDFASARLAQYDLAQDFIRIWTRHPQFAQDAAVLSELNGIHVVYLACRNSVHPLGVTFRVGMRLLAQPPQRQPSVDGGVALPLEQPVGIQIIARAEEVSHCR